MIRTVPSKRLITYTNTLCMNVIQTFEPTFRKSTFAASDAFFMWDEIPITRNIRSVLLSTVIDISYYLLLLVQLVLNEKYGYCKLEKSRFYW